jgi:hypothetical protein
VYGYFSATLYTKATYNFLAGQLEEKDSLDGITIHENKKNNITNDLIDAESAWN